MSRLPLFLHRIAHFLYRYRVPVVPSLIALLNRLIFSCYIGPGARIGKGVEFAYAGLGIVIHNESEIGDNVQIGTGVTLGGRSKLPSAPKIGPNAIISTGAKILGPVKIGMNAVVGANAVVIHDVEPSTVVAGIPARVIKRDIDIGVYHSSFDKPD